MNFDPNKQRIKGTFLQRVNLRWKSFWRTRNPMTVLAIVIASFIFIGALLIFFSNEEQINNIGGIILVQAVTIFITVFFLDKFIAAHAEYANRPRLYLIHKRITPLYNQAKGLWDMVAYLSLELDEELRKLDGEEARNKLFMERLGNEPFHADVANAIPNLDAAITGHLLERPIRESLSFKAAKVREDIETALRLNDRYLENDFFVALSNLASCNLLSYLAHIDEETDLPRNIGANIVFFEREGRSSDVFSTDQHKRDDFRDLDSLPVPENLAHGDIFTSVADHLDEIAVSLNQRDILLARRRTLFSDVGWQYHAYALESDRKKDGA